jgi:hypothetical protein
MAAGVRELVTSYKGVYGLSTQEAAARVQRTWPPEDARRALQAPPDHVSWTDLEALLRHDPERDLRHRGEVQRAASEDLRIGHRACQAVEVLGSTPWSRAQYLSLRQELTDGWQPQNGVEQQLVDARAPAQTDAEFWLERVMARAARAAAIEDAVLRHKGKWELPGVNGFQTPEHAGAMVDRFNRISMRTQRALRDIHQGGLRPSSCKTPAM